ncbi:MAG: thioesterase, partial [Sphingobacteriia bacterium 39-39-8]
MNPKFESFQKIIQNPIKFRFFLLQKLPSALIAGLKVQEISTLEAVITVKHKWLNQNPFRSMYFAVQSMAAEMSTGLLAFGQLY